MREKLLEIWSSMRCNRLRTALTGFAVAWGIFMLVVLLGAGNGLKHAVMQNFEDRATNTVEIYAGWTSAPYHGYKKGRAVELSGKDGATLQREIPHVAATSAAGRYGGKRLAAGKLWITAYLEGTTPQNASIDGVKILDGRFINRTDLDQKRKVIVIDAIARKALFPESDFLGEQVELDGIPYRVVGVYDSPSYRNQSFCYVPLTTGQLLYAGGKDAVDRVVLSLNDVKSKAEMEKLESTVRARLAYEHNFAPTDESAVWIYNNYEDYETVGIVFGGITLFIWLIGIGTLMAGIVGVSNIMLVTVRERTSEFGIRKALGARPRSITGSILTEAVMVTALFGYMGMVAGVSVMEVVGYYVDKAVATTGDFVMFSDPTPDLSIAVGATIVLVLAGLIAGWIPARRAARLKTVDALKYNK